MKIQIRSGVFETASSAVNAFCWSSKGMENNHLKVHNDGCVYVVLDHYYGKDCEQLFTQKEKLKYVVTWFCHYYNFDNGNDWYYWGLFVEAFCKYVNTHPTGRNGNNICENIQIIFKLGNDSYDYFDHQLINDYDYDQGTCLVNLWDAKKCVEFIFNKYIGVEMGTD